MKRIQCLILLQIFIAINMSLVFGQENKNIIGKYRSILTTETETKLEIKKNKTFHIEYWDDSQTWEYSGTWFLNNGILTLITNDYKENFKSQIKGSSDTIFFSVREGNAFCPDGDKNKKYWDCVVKLKNGEVPKQSKSN